MILMNMVKEFLIIKKELEANSPNENGLYNYLQLFFVFQT
ncbi:hypothetical protein C2W59_01503 [Bacillus pumilus]|nr:hypothetical protein C2W59_01503 [Bacillus pumilus]